MSQSERADKVLMSKYERMADIAERIKDIGAELETMCAHDKDYEPYKLHVMVRDNLRQIDVLLDDIERLI